MKRETMTHCIIVFETTEKSNKIDKILPDKNIFQSMLLQFDTAFGRWMETTLLIKLIITEILFCIPPVIFSWGSYG